MGGFFINNGTPKYERLVIANVKSMGIDWITNTEVFKILIKNTGTIDSRLEHLFVNGSLTHYGSEGLGAFKLHNPGEYLVILHGSEAEVCFLYDAKQYLHFEVILHTSAGNDFSQVLTLPKTLN